MRKALLSFVVGGWLAALVWTFATASPYQQGLLIGVVFCAASFVVPMVLMLRTLPDRGAAQDELDAIDEQDELDAGAQLAITMAGGLERGAMYSTWGWTVKRWRDGAFIVTQGDHTGLCPWPFADAKRAVSFCAHCAPLEQWQFTPTDIDGAPRVVRVERPKQLTTKGDAQ